MMGRLSRPQPSSFGRRASIPAIACRREEKVVRKLYRHRRASPCSPEQRARFPEAPERTVCCLSGLRDLGADLGVGQGLAVEVPRTVDGVDDVDEYLVLRLPAAGHLMNDVCRLLEIALLGL